MHNDKRQPLEMGINYFKRELKAMGIKGKTYNKLVRAFKKRSWMEIEGMIRSRGMDPAHVGPSHRTYGKKIEVKGVETKSYAYKIEVRHG